MKYCSKCGKELLDSSEVCNGCGCWAPKMPVSSRKSSGKIYNSAISQYQERRNESINLQNRGVQNSNYSYTPNIDVHYSQENDNYGYGHSSRDNRKSALGLVSIILAICAILLNCLFALLGHAGAIVAIVLGIIAITKASRDAKGYIGLGLGVLAELFAIINSLIGSGIGAQIGANIGSMFAGM